MKYGIGLDIGIASVGYAVVKLNKEDEPCGILRMGVRIFDAAENPKDGASLAAPRREKRSMRRRLRRHRHRLERIRNLLVASGLVTDEQLGHLYDGQLPDIYALRVRALDEKLTDAELCRVLIHLAQRRGFRSNRKSDAQDKEAGAILSAVSLNEQRMAEKGYRTVGEMLYLDAEFAEHKRNKGGDYLSTVKRDLIAEEAKLILATQAAMGNARLTDAFRDKYMDILLSQRPFDLGPGGNSPYGGNQIENMIGHCTFEPEELRAAKATWSFEYFQLLQKVNQIQLVKAGTKTFLTQDQRQAVVALVLKSASVTYAAIRKALDIAPEYTFNTVSYRDGVEEAEKKQKLKCMQAYHEIRKALDKAAPGRMQELTTEQKNAIGYAMTAYKSDEPIIASLQAAGLRQADIDQLLLLKGFSTFGHLSTKACEKIIPYLEQGMQYNDACTAAGYAFRGHDKEGRAMYLPAVTAEMEQITSPVARRSISQTIKVINAIIREQGNSPTFVNVELAREMSKDFGERKDAMRSMEENAKKNEEAMERLHLEYGLIHPTGQDLVKFKLYQEQDGVCAYSLQHFDISRLFEPGYAEVDHIVPYSISFDDTYKNKVLVFARENREKGNRLPLQYLTGKQREDFIVYTNVNVRNYRKRQNLLREGLSEEEKKAFKERNLTDTKTISRFMYNYINDNLEFAPFESDRKRHVQAVNGAVTAYMRKRWGIKKVREDGDLHHASDALVIACTTAGMINRISRYSELREAEYVQMEDGSYRVNPETGELLERFPYPWSCFRNEWEARISDDPQAALTAMKLTDYDGLPVEDCKPIFVSRMPKHKVTGAAHLETIRSAKKADEGVTVLKTALTSLKLKDGEIEGYYQPESDRLLYEALKKRLTAYGGNAAKAFAEPFYKPKADGTQGPLVKKVKIETKSTMNVPVLAETAVADNGSMVRIDIFHVEGDGYYFVPVYVADTVKDVLPNKASVAFKPYAEWKEMKDEDFIFSLYPSDLVYVEHKKGIALTSTSDKSDKIAPKSTLLYYVSAGIAGSVLTMTNHDRSYMVASLGIKTLVKFEKYQVDVLGNITKVGKEKRMSFR